MIFSWLDGGFNILCSVARRLVEDAVTKWQMYSLSDAFAIPTSFVRILFADRVGQSAIEGPRPDDTGQEITQLRVQLRR